MKGIILAGGVGTRLYPSTISTSKQLLSVYDKPMIYYPLSTLMLAGIREVMIISTPEDLGKYEAVFGDGTRLGMTFSYAFQKRPEGIAQAFIIAADFINNQPCCLILGDNLFYGHGLSKILQQAGTLQKGALIFGYQVKDPQRYGIVELTPEGKAIRIIEKPRSPRSKYAVPGIYFYDSQVVEMAKALKPSARGELEITDINQAYLEKDQLQVKLLGRGVAWLDTGTPDSLIEAANFVAAIERRQGQKIACIEEVAYHMGYIDQEQMQALLAAMPAGNYRDYLSEIYAAGLPK